MTEAGNIGELGDTSVNEVENGIHEVRFECVPQQKSSERKFIVGCKL